MIGVGSKSASGGRTSRSTLVEKLVLHRLGYIGTDVLRITEDWS